MHRDSRSRLDPNYLTPFNNGVLDLKTLHFEHGRPEENQVPSKSMLVDCILYDENNPHEKHLEILEWFGQVQPDESLRTYLQKLVGMLLTSDTNQQKIWVLSGACRNGKSFFINKMLKPAMGSFYGTGSTSLLTRTKERANEANPALVDLIGKRIAVFHEPASNEVIQADILRVMSGEEQITVRANYGKQVRFTPTFKTFIICTDKPNLSEDSQDVWRRVRVIDWPMKFAESPDRNVPNERQLDPRLEARCKAWPPYFAGLMVHWLKQYREEGLVEPVSVKRYTRQYEEEHDD